MRICENRVRSATTFGIAPGSRELKAKIEAFAETHRMWKDLLVVYAERFTEMGARGEHNVGQLARGEYGDDVFLVGFGTDHGTRRQPVHLSRRRLGHIEVGLRQPEVAAGLAHRLRAAGAHELPKLRSPVVHRPAPC
jgi:hypothetical protein